MNRLRLITLVLFFMLLFVDAQSISNPHNDAVSNFRPSLAIVIGILCAMFALPLSLVACIRFCKRRATDQGGDDHLPTSLHRTKSGLSGIDKKVIDSLPFFKFSSLKGAKQGLGCAVCLSKFEDIELLRLLPQCKHAFHVECIDEWLEKHSSCPLCRNIINPHDPAILTYSNSFRFLRNGSSSNMELGEDHSGSSRFIIGASFRKISEMTDIIDDDDDGRAFHKGNVVFKNRWSNLSSSDIMVLNSEMISDIFGEFKETNKAIENDKTMKINEGFEIKIDTDSSTSRIVNDEGDPKRSMSDITVLSRFQDINVITRNRTSESLSENYTNEDMTVRRKWLQIARRTIRWFSNRETRSQIQPIQ